MTEFTEELESVRNRLAERFGVSEAPEVLLHVPAEVLRDMSLNLIRALDSEPKILDRGARLLIGLSVATSKGNALLSKWLEHAARAAGKTHEECESAKSVALTCAVYAGYYKFRSLAGTNEYDSFQPGLRATPFVRSLLDKKLVELICIAVSIQNGCSHCVHGHVRAAKEAGASITAIDETVRTGAVIGALASWASHS